MDLELETEENYYFKVKLGKLTYEIELSSLIAVMANQIISSNPALSHEENYDIAFEVTKNEIFDYLQKRQPHLKLLMQYHCLMRMLG